jgi:hypothetical protein
MDTAEDTQTEQVKLSRLLFKRTIERLILYFPASFITVIAYFVAIDRHMRVVLSNSENLFQWFESGNWLFLPIYAVILSAFFAVGITFRFSAAVGALILPVPLVIGVFFFLYISMLILRVSNLTGALICSFLLTALFIYSFCRWLSFMAEAEAEMILMKKSGLNSK